MSQLFLRAIQVVSLLVCLEATVVIINEPPDHSTTELFLLAGATFALCEIASRLEDLPKKLKDKD